MDPGVLHYVLVEPGERVGTLAFPMHGLCKENVLRPTGGGNLLGRHARL